ncbi:YbaN family protein [Marivita sp. S0852]|uniref:YbaN family protein n=1 Tax=Marivita sp. S0852 TaxID=3373893 RepID=UPI00398263DC
MMIRSIWTVFGAVSLAFAALGVVLPVLPTTPLVILAAFCFTRGSPRLAAMLENHPVFGPILSDWRASGAIATRFKVIAVGMMAAAFAVSVVAGVPPFVLAVQAVCMLGAGAYVVTRPGRQV